MQDEFRPALPPLRATFGRAPSSPSGPAAPARAAADRRASENPSAADRASWNSPGLSASRRSFLDRLRRTRRVEAPAGPRQLEDLWKKRQSRHNPVAARAFLAQSAGRAGNSNGAKKTHGRPFNAAAADRKTPRLTPRRNNASNERKPAPRNRRCRAGRARRRGPSRNSPSPSRPWSA